MNLAGIFYLLAHVGGSGMAVEDRAIRMDVEESNGSVAVELVARSSDRQTVSYDVEILGSSRAAHRGTTQIPAAREITLSRFNVAHRGEWCATVTVREENHPEYVLKAGPCG